MLDINSCINKYYAPESKKGSDIYLEKQKMREQKIQEKDGSEILKLLKNISKDYAVVDFTDEEACCYEYFILLHKNQDILDNDTELMKALNGLRYDLKIFISILDKYYYMFIEEITYDETNVLWSFDIKNLDKRYINQDVDTLIKNIDTALRYRGYLKLYYEDVIRHISDIEVTYKEIQDVLVFDLLFTDLVTVIKS